MKIFNKKSNLQNDSLKKNNLLSISELLVIRGGTNETETTTRSDGDSGGLI